jgi:DNA-binding transcriptional MerR regulator
MSEPSLIQKFSIKTTARMVDMNSHTIRAWERRYKALDPDRNEANNRRQYSQRDVERLSLLARLVRQGHQISHIAGLSNDILETMLMSEPGDAKIAAPPVEQLILGRCIAALEKYELVLIQAELEAARNLISAEHFLTQIAVPLLRDVGARVYNGTFSIAQEHALSSILRAQLMQTLFNLRNAIAVRAFTRKDQEHGLSICLATRDGDLHEFGILASAILVANEGHVPHYFGPNLPSAALADAARAVNADVVIVGNTPSAEPFGEQRQETYARDLQNKISSSCQIWWGGVCTIKNPELLGRVLQIHTLESLKENLRSVFPHSKSRTTV